MPVKLLKPLFSPAELAGLFSCPPLFVLTGKTIVGLRRDAEYGTPFLNDISAFPSYCAACPFLLSLDLQPSAPEVQEFVSHLLPYRT